MNRQWRNVGKWLQEPKNGCINNLGSCYGQWSTIVSLRNNGKGQSHDDVCTMSRQILHRLNEKTKNEKRVNCVIWASHIEK